MKLGYDIASHLGEAAHPNHFRDALEKIIEANKRMLPRKDRAGQRAQHPKAHATVPARFTALTLPPEHQALQVGLFAALGESREAVIRFSNSSNMVDNPKGGDAHGMAIKIFGVPGEKFEPDPDAGPDPDQGTFDFILLNNETFFDGRLLRYAKLNTVSGDFFGFKRNGRPRLAGLLSLARVLVMTKLTDPDLGRAITDTSDQLPVSPLQETFFSTTPYLLGPDHAVKYVVRPAGRAETEDGPVRRAPHPDENHLNKALRRGLLASEKRFILSAQLRRPGDDHYSVEDPSKPWDQAPEVALAEIVLPQLTDASDATWQAMRFAQETRRYNIWNVTAEHRPLGVLNRLRRATYKELGRTRRHQDGDVYT